MNKKKYDHLDLNPEIFDILKRLKKRRSLLSKPLYHWELTAKEYRLVKDTPYFLQELDEKIHTRQIYKEIIDHMPEIDGVVVFPKYILDFAKAADGCHRRDFYAALSDSLATDGHWFLNETLQKNLLKRIKARNEVIEMLSSIN